MVNPKSEIRRIGRRPKRSLRLPSIGENKNCMIEKENISQPLYNDALLKSLPTKWLIYLGITGNIIPNPITSNNRVMKINPSAGFLLFLIFFKFIPANEQNRKFVGQSKSVNTFF